MTLGGSGGVMQKNYNKTSDSFKQSLQLNYEKGIYNLKINCGSLQEIKKIEIE